MDINFALVDACRHNDLDTVKSLLSERPRSGSFRPSTSEQNIDIHYRDELAFREACYFGHLEVVKYLISLNMNINIHADNEDAFRYACFNGYLELVKYLISLNKGIKYLNLEDRNINIHAENEDAFRFACCNGHLEVVKYLISLNENINIHAYNEYAFQIACRNSHLNIVRYLWEIDKTFKLKRNDGWSPDILKWYNEEYLKVNPNIRDIIEKDQLCIIKEGIMRKCNICYDEKHVIMFGCHEDHGLCKECFLEYYDEGIQYKCIYCMKELTVDNMYITK